MRHRTSTGNFRNKCRTAALDSSARDGALLVEFALVCPILFMFMCACFEFARVAMVRSSIANAAYEGARRASVPGSKAEQAIQSATAQATVQDKQAGAAQKQAQAAKIEAETIGIRQQIGLTQQAAMMSPAQPSEEELIQQALAEAETA